MTSNLFKAYGGIDEIKLKEDSVWIMGAYQLTDPLARLIKQLEKV